MFRLLIWLRALLRATFFRSRVEAELNEELGYHVEREVLKRVESGQTLDEARLAAVRAMGAIERSKEECRDVRGGREMAAVGRFFRDCRFAVRLFRRHPAPVCIAVSGLALAIGVVTAVFSIVNASMLRPHGMRDPSSVVSIARPGHAVWVGLPYAEFLRMRDANTLAGVEAAVSARVRISFTRDGQDIPRQAMSFVSAGYLGMLGARPELGRTLGAADDIPGAVPAVVISHHFWMTALEGDPEVIGRTVWVDRTPATLVGVLEPGFTGPQEPHRSIWASFGAHGVVTSGVPSSPASRLSVEVFARLRPDVSLAAATNNLNALLDPADASSASRASGRVQVQSAASPIAGLMDGDTFVGLVCVIGIVGLVLAVACVNAATLLMASALTRGREVGVRLAMGATRGRLITQMLSESLVLGMAAGSLGFLVAFWLVPIFARLAAISNEVDAAPDGVVLLFAVAVALVCGVGAGVTPALHASRGSVVATLQTSGSSRRGAMIPRRFRMWFIGLQTAVSLILLISASLLARSAVKANSTDVAFDVDQLLGVSFAMPRTDFDEQTYMRTALATVLDLPLVERASMAQNQPFGGTVERDRFMYGGRSFALDVVRADAEFLSTVGIPVVRGRGLTADDVAQEAPVALISESVARTFFPERDPVGQMLSDVPADAGNRQAPATIIGVVPDALMRRLDTERSGAVYRPISRERSNPPNLIVRSVRPAAASVAVEDALRRIDPRVQLSIRLVRAGLDDYRLGAERIAWLVAPGAVLALALAALGVYGLTTFVISQRLDEVSVRMALGASPWEVLRLLTADSLRPVFAGLVVGLIVAMALSAMMARQLSGISPHDPFSIATASAMLMICAVAAVLLPARRAARTDPASLLRES